MRAFHLLSLCLLAASLSVAQTQSAPATSSAPDKAAVEEVKAYCSALDDYKKNTNPQFFADASDTAKPMWRRVGTERELDALTDAQFQHVFTAKVWLKDSKVVAVEGESNAAAGDWFLSADYCFRPDGTLAALHSEYHDDRNDYIALHDETYDATGNQIASDVQTLDSRSRRPKKIPKAVAATEVRAPLYRTTAELPFHRLLTTR